MSETVKRYDPALCDCDYCYGEMQRAPDGDWVAYDDYAALAQQLADVDYLAKWEGTSTPDALFIHGYQRNTDGGWDAFEAHLEAGVRYVIASAPSLPALGAAVRAIGAQRTRTRG